jgi:hypothetical protein
MGAINREEAQFIEGFDESEGATLSSRPPSPDGETFEPKCKPSPAQAPANPRGVEKLRSKIVAARRKRTKRVENTQKRGSEREYCLKPSVAERLSNFSTTAVGFDAQDMVAGGAGSYIGSRSNEKGKVWKLDALLERGYKLIEWNGRYLPCLHGAVSKIERELLQRPACDR